MALEKKRVHWKETNPITGVTKDEDVDILTSADAVLCDDGKSLQEKIDSKELMSGKELAKHITDLNNPHKLTPDLLGVYNKQYIDELITRLINNNTVLSSNADFAEIGEWADGNPNIEDRVGYFVSVDKTEAGITMKKATSESDVRGVTVETPAFAANASSDKFEDGLLSYKYGYIAFAGFAIIYDYGRCAVNSRCISDDNGCAIPSDNTMGYQVIERVDGDRVLILVEPNADMLNRIKRDIDTLFIRNAIVNGDTDKVTYQFGQDDNGIYYRSVT